MSYLSATIDSYDDRGPAGRADSRASVVGRRRGQAGGVRTGTRGGRGCPARHGRPGHRGQPRPGYPARRAVRDPTGRGRPAHPALRWRTDRLGGHRRLGGRRRGRRWRAGLWAGVAVAAAGLDVTVWQALRRYTRVARQWTEGHQVLTHYDDRAVVQAAAKNVRYTATAWPQLHAHVDLDDPTPVLVGQLWDLTLLVGERAAARELRKKLQMAEYGVPDGTSTAAELADRISRTDANVARLTQDIDQRRTYPWRLADEVAGFVNEQQALSRARAMIHELDQRRGLPPPAC